MSKCDDILLKPCPFCGGKAKLEHMINISNIASMSFIECSKCHARSGSFEVSAKYSADMEAINSWNARVKNWVHITSGEQEHEGSDL